MNNNPSNSGSHQVTRRSVHTTVNSLALFRQLLASAVASIPLLLNHQASAADGTWINTTSGGLWSDTANWSGGIVADGSGFSANFTGMNITAANTVLFDAPHTLGALSFDDTSASHHWTLSNNGDPANVLTLDSSATISLARCNLTNNTVIAGSSGLTVTNLASACYLILDATNTFTGDVNVNNSTAGHLYLVANKANALGGSGSSPNSVVLAASTGARAQLFLNASGASYPSYNQLIMRPTGSSANSRTELHSRSGNATWNGDILLDGVNSTGSSVICDIYCDASSATLTINGNIVVTNGFPGFFNLRGGTSGSASKGIVRGTINIGDRPLGKNDPNVWTISSTGNTWGSLNVQNTFLALGTNDALCSTAPIQFSAGGAYVDMNGYAQTMTTNVTGGTGRGFSSSLPGAVLTFNSLADISCSTAISSNVSLVKTGSAILSLTSANTYVGETLINEGTLSVSGTITGSTNIIIGAGATLNAASPLTLGTTQRLKPVNASSLLTGTLNVGSATLELNYTNSAPTLTVDAGNLVLSASSVAIINVPNSITAGVYEVVTTANAGQVSGTMPSSVIINGVPGMVGVLTVSNSNLYVTLDTKPAITGQFPSTENNSFTFFAGASPTFSVSASGTNLSYLWFTNGVLNAGATNTSLIASGLQIGAFSAHCIVTNSSGSATSLTWTASVIAAPTETYPAAVLADSPLGYWRLNEPDNGLANKNAGVTAHDYLGGNNGTYTNTDLGLPGYNLDTDPTTTSARFGYSDFNNSVASDIKRIDFGAANGTTNAFSVEAWVNGYPPISDSGIVTKGYGSGGEQFNLDTGGNGVRGLRFFVRDAGGVARSASSSIVLEYGTWRHVVGVCDQPNGKVLLYVDGKLAGSTTIATNGGILNSDVPMSIGSRYSSASAWSSNLFNEQFAGNINDVAVYGFALSSNQVLAHYESAGIPPSITQQPPAYTNVNYGGTLIVPAAASGSQPLSYHWYDFNAGSYIAGQTNANLMLTNVQADNLYYLTVSNAFGSVDSDIVYVSIITGLTATMVPNTNLALFIGQTVNYQVTASGNEPMHYQWSTNNVSIAGETNATYSPTIQMGTVAIRCTVTNSYNGFSSVTLGPVNLTGVAAPTNAYELAVLGNNPIAYWPLNEPDNGLNDGNPGVTAYDYVGGHNLTYTNVKLGLPGINASTSNGLTASLFGVFSAVDSVGKENDYSSAGISPIDFAKPVGTDATFSVEAWVNLTNSVSAASIVAKGCGHTEQFALDIVGGGFRFTFRSASGTARSSGVSATAAVGQWYHIVGVWDGPNGAGRLYVNGTNVTSNTGLATGLGMWTPALNANLPGSELLNFGSRPSDIFTNVYDTQFPGRLANVAIYDYALDASNIAAHYSSGIYSPPIAPTPGLLSITNLSAGQVKLTWDFSGTLQGATNVTGPYEDIIDATSPHTVTSTNSRMFYRIKQQ